MCNNALCWSKLAVAGLMFAFAILFFSLFSARFSSIPYAKVESSNLASLKHKTELWNYIKYTDWVEFFFVEIIKWRL